MSTQPTPQPDQFQYVKLPDGSYGKFRADASDDVIKSAIEKDFPGTFQNANAGQATQNTIGSAPTGVGQWFHNLEADMRYGSDLTLPGKVMRKLGRTSGVGDSGTANFIGGPIIGPTQIGQGISQMGEHPVRGAVKIMRGIGTTAALPVAMVTAGAPAAAIRPLIMGTAGSAVAGKTAQVMGADKDTQELASDIGGMAAGAASNKLPKVLSRALLLGKTPAAAYESALKPSTTLSPTERANIVNTAIKERIPVSQKGLEKLGGLIDDINSEIKQTINTDPNRPISTAPAALNALRLQNRPGIGIQVNPRADVAAVKNAAREFLDIYGHEVPAAQAQALKQGTYKALGDKAYGELQTASKEAQKALARGLKEELANQFPELKDLNARDSRLIDLQDALELAVGRISNRDFMGIGTPMAAAGVRAVTNSNKAAAVFGVMKAVLENPRVKSSLAISLGNRTPLPIAMQRVQNYLGLLGSPAASRVLPFLRGSQPSPSQSPDQ